MYYPQTDHEKAVGVKPMPLPPEETYTNGKGEEIKYHSYFVNGPYSTVGAAKGRLTGKTEGYGPRWKKDFIVYAEVESSTGIWTPVAPKK